MYLDTAIFVNRAPLEHLELNFKEKGINVLSAINGKGKTTILSYIVDAFYEIARPHYKNSFHGIENHYYRISSELDALDNSKASYVFLRFSNNGEFYDYLDIRNNISIEDFSTYLPQDNRIKYSNIKNEIDDRGFGKFLSSNLNDKDIKAILNNSICTYFPAYRHEQPSYLTDRSISKSFCPN